MAMTLPELLPFKGCEKFCDVEEQQRKASVEMPPLFSMEG